MASTSESAYKTALCDVLASGEKRGDRTGTGTLSMFGLSRIYDVSASFPLMTSKKMFFNKLVHELIWFMKGNTSLHGLHGSVHPWWKDFADEDGDLGPVYGHNFRRLECDTENVDWVKNRTGPEEIPYEADVEAWEAQYEDSNVFSLWINMMLGCYMGVGKTKSAYVSESWRTFANFKKTISQVPFYGKWAMGGAYELTNLYYKSKCFDASTCIFASADHIEDMIFNDRIPKSEHAPDGYSLRRTVIKDQMSWLINEIKTNPTSRRMIVSAWNVPEIQNMALPPCHTMFQVYVNQTTGKMDLMLYQRSGDMFLGVPYNIASYSLLLMVLCKLTGYVPGRFIHNIGDAHIYLNHIDQVKSYVNNPSHPSPQVKISDELVDLDTMDISMFELVGYECEGPIKAPLAV